MDVQLVVHVNPKVVIYIIIGILFTAGISIVSFAEMFSETWFIGLALIGISIVIIAITVALKMKK